MVPGFERGDEIIVLFLSPGMFQCSEVGVVDIYLRTRGILYCTVYSNTASPVTIYE